MTAVMVERDRLAATSGANARLLQVVAKRLRPGRMTQLGHCFPLDLADTFPRQLERPADLVQRSWLAVLKPVAHTDYRRLTSLQRSQDRLQLRPHQSGLDRGLGRR